MNSKHFASANILLPLLSTVLFFFIRPPYSSDIGINLGVKSLDIVLHLNKISNRTFKSMQTGKVFKIKQNGFEFSTWPSKAKTGTDR